MLAEKQQGGFVMAHVKVDLKNCYGIKDLEKDFDFSGTPAFAIYAPNGSMKSSLAKTFKDAADGEDSSDRFFPNRKTTRKIRDEADAEIDGDRILVVLPYDEELGHSEKTSTLLVDAKLRKEYEQLHLEVKDATDKLLSAIKTQAKSKKRDFAREISSAFMPVGNDLRGALLRIKHEVLEQKDTPLADVEYDKIFDEKVLAALGMDAVKSAIEDYCQRYNDLLEASTYFKKGTFDYYNAAQIAKNLADNGFFEAKHTVHLNSEGEVVEIKTEKELADLIAKEKSEILSDAKLKTAFDKADKVLVKNAQVRDFRQYMLDNPALVSHLANIAQFKQDILKQYFRVHLGLFEDLMEKVESTADREKEIEAEAAKQRTQWDRVIDIFNARFVVPYKLTSRNRTAVIMGVDPIMDLSFTYIDGTDTVNVDKDELLKSLSTGEKRALYILNVIFEIETRKKAGQETLVILDDVADSFDYQNKYAIIQYLKQISDDNLFKQIIMTHNFDFFRTIKNRFVGYPNCLMAFKTENGVTLTQARAIDNVFVNDWKENFFSDSKKKIASVPFLRNLVEFSEGDKDPKYTKLTLVLHWKPNSARITVKDLDEVYNNVCKTTGESLDPTKKVWQLIEEEAEACLNADAGVNFENKIVLAIAIRIKAEKFMVKEISDDAFVDAIDRNQTQTLFQKFNETSSDQGQIDILDRVIVMTPENIHLNSFMYEPIIDMSDEHLKCLYKDVKALA